MGWLTEDQICPQDGQLATRVSTVEEDMNTLIQHTAHLEGFLETAREATAAVDEGGEAAKPSP